MAPVGASYVRCKRIDLADGRQQGSGKYNVHLRFVKMANQIGQITRRERRG